MLKHCISLNVQIKNRSNENIPAFLQYILVLFTIFNRLYPRSLKKRFRVGDENTYLSKERKQISYAHSPTLDCLKSDAPERIVDSMFCSLERQN